MLSALSWDPGCPSGYHHPRGQWREHSHRQRDHSAEPLVANPIFISYLTNMVRSGALTQQLLFISTSQEWRPPIISQKQKAAPPPRDKFTILPKTEVLEMRLYTLLESEIFGVSNSFGFFGTRDLYFIFTLIPLAFVKLHTLSVKCVWEEEFVGGGICEAMPSGKMTVNTLALESLSSGNRDSKEV